jgi:hypothetical protein
MGLIDDKSQAVIPKKNKGSYLKKIEEKYSKMLLHK